MSKDRQEKKLKQARVTESDRDQSLDYPGATRLDTPEEAREMNQMNPK
ncbi:YpzI family protein [Bacillus timonensis]|nr:YpzI family protein [Bacillus timonensis]